MAKTRNMSNPIKKAIVAAGTAQKLADKLGITRSTIYAWREIPTKYIIEIERITKVPREELRPDLYRKSKRTSEMAAAE
jgi:DNA-binding transcriptional regulator YdaS (Cro superfamily)